MFSSFVLWTWRWQFLPFVLFIVMIRLTQQQNFVEGLCFNIWFCDVEEDVCDNDSSSNENTKILHHTLTFFRVPFTITYILRFNTHTQKEMSSISAEYEYTLLNQYHLLINQLSSTIPFTSKNIEIILKFVRWGKRKEVEQYNNWFLGRECEWVSGRVWRLQNKRDKGTCCRWESWNKKDDDVDED